MRLRYGLEREREWCGEKEGEGRMCYQFTNWVFTSIFGVKSGMWDLFIALFIPYELIVPFTASIGYVLLSVYLYLFKFSCAPFRMCMFAGLRFFFFKKEQVYMYRFLQLNHKLIVPLLLILFI